MLPALRPLPEGAATDHLTAVLVVPKPLAVAVNCCWVPIITALLGLTVIEGVIGVGVADTCEAEEKGQAAINRQIAEILACVTNRSKMFISPASIYLSAFLLNAFTFRRFYRRSGMLAAILTPVLCGRRRGAPQPAPESSANRIRVNVPAGEHCAANDRPA
jgi:hypothetical protein